MEKRVNYGYVEKIHGLRGRLVLKLFVLGPAVPVDQGTVLHLDGTPYTVVRSRKRDNERITVDLEGVFSRETADPLRGSTVTALLSDVLRDGFPIPVNGFADFTLVSGDSIFAVEEVQYNSTNPQLLVSGAGKTFSVPLNMALTGEIDAGKRTITLQLPQGLEEI